MPSLPGVVALARARGALAAIDLDPERPPLVPRRGNGRLVADQVAVAQDRGDRLDGRLELRAAGRLVAARRVVVEALHDLRGAAGVVRQLGEGLRVELRRVALRRATPAAAEAAAS